MNSEMTDKGETQKVSRDALNLPPSSQKSKKSSLPQIWSRTAASCVVFLSEDITV
jgi:hypothetical protein